MAGEIKKVVFAEGLNVLPPADVSVDLPMTTNGDLITRAGGAPTRLGVGIEGQSLRVVSGAPAWADGGGGSGEINLIENPSAASNTAGWTPGADHTVTRLTSDSPLGAQTSTAFRFAKTAASATTETSTSGVYDPFTVPVGLRDTPLKVEPYIIVPATGVWRVSVYDGSTRLPLRSDSGGFTTLPAGFTGRVQLRFDTTSSSAYTLSFTETSGVISDIDVTNIIVGPGIQPQGAVVSAFETAPVSWLNTPTFNATALIAPVLLVKRVGGDMHARFGFRNGSGGAATGAGALALNIPNGLTIDTTRIGANVGGATLIGSSWNTGPNALNLIFLNRSDNTIRFSGNDNITDIVASEGITCEFTIPINEWAGSGNANLGQNDVEYAWNSDTTNADTTASGFSYGPSGAAFGSYNATRSKGVRFLSPRQDTDDYTLEILNENTWIDAADSFFASFSNTLGMCISRPSSGNANDVEVVFGSAGYNGQPGAAASTWSTPAGSPTLYRWRVKKTSGGAVVGYGRATATASGLVSREFQATHATTFRGNAGGSNSASVNIDVSRVGRTVTLVIPATTAVVPTTASTILISNTMLPTWARPLTLVNTVHISYNNGAYVESVMGLLNVTTAGRIDFYRSINAPAFTNSANAGWYDTTISYVSA